MLTLEQLLTYEQFDIFIIIFALAMIIISIIIKSNNLDESLSILFGVLGFVMLAAVVLAIITTTITPITITPCSITQGRSMYYIADTADNIYVAEPDTVLKIHINQPIIIEIRTGLLQRYPLIVNATGDICKTLTPTCQPYWNWTYYNLSNYSPLGPNDTIINIPPSKFEYL